jgi:hypothetical protein
MSKEARAVAKDELEKLSQKIRTLRAQAQGQRTLIEIRNAGGLTDPFSVDTAALLQAAQDYHAIVTEAKQAQNDADALHESLYG